MGESIGRLAIQDFANMLHMDDYGTFAHKADDTKGVLYLDGSNKLCNANRHSKSVTIGDVSLAQKVRNKALRESLLSALADAGFRNQDRLRQIRIDLGLPPLDDAASVGKQTEGATAPGEKPKATVPNQSGSDVPEMYKPLERSKVKLLLKEALDALSDQAVLRMTTSELKAMSNKETQTHDRINRFIEDCKFLLKPEASEVNGKVPDPKVVSILNGNLESVLRKYATLRDDNANEIAKLGQSTGLNVAVKNALVRNKTKFIETLTFDEAQALSWFCAFGKGALRRYGQRLAPNLDRLDWTHVQNLFVQYEIPDVQFEDLADFLNSYSNQDGTFGVEDLLGESYLLARDLEKICADVVKHFESKPRAEAVDRPEESVEVAKSGTQPAEAVDLWRSDTAAYCETFLRSLCEQDGILNDCNRERFREFLETRPDVPKDAVDSFVDAWRILVKIDDTGGRSQSGVLANARMRSRLLAAAERIKAGGTTSADVIKARLMQAVLDEIGSIAGLMKDGRNVSKLPEKPDGCFKAQSFNGCTDSIVSTYNALMMTEQANEVREMEVKESDKVSQWNFFCRNPKDGRQIVVTKKEVADLKVYEPKQKSNEKSNWYETWGVTYFEKAAFLAMKKAGFVDADVSFGYPYDMAYVFRLFGLGKPEVFGQAEGRMSLADVLQFAHEAQVALSEGRPCVLRKKGHCYPVTGVDLSDPLNPKISVCEGHPDGDKDTENSDYNKFKFAEKTFQFDIVGESSLKWGFEVFVTKKVPQFEELKGVVPQTEAKDDVIDTTVKGIEKLNLDDVNIEEVSENEDDAAQKENGGETLQNEAVGVERPAAKVQTNVAAQENIESEINEPQQTDRESPQEEVAKQPVEPQSVEPQPVGLQSAEPQPVAKSGAEQSLFGESWVQKATSDDGRNQRERISKFHKKLSPDQQTVVEQIFNRRQTENSKRVTVGWDPYPKSDYQLWQEAYCEFVLLGMCGQKGILNPENKQVFRDFLSAERTGLTGGDVNAMVDAWEVLTKKIEVPGRDAVFSTHRDMVLWTGLQTVSETVTDTQKNADNSVTPEWISKEMEAAVLNEISRIADAMKANEPVLAKNVPGGVEFVKYFKAQALHGNTCPIISTVNALLSSDKSQEIMEMMKIKKEGGREFYEFPYRADGQNENVRVTADEIGKMEIPKVDSHGSAIGPFSDFEKAVFCALQKTGLIGVDAYGKKVRLGDLFEVSGVFQLFGMAEPSCRGKTSGTMMNSEVLQHAHVALEALRAGKPCVFRQDVHFRAIIGVDLSNSEDPTITVVESLGGMPTRCELKFSRGELQKPFQIYFVEK